MRVVSGHSSSPEYNVFSVGARLDRGKGPGTNLGGSGPEMFIESRFHVSICIGVICMAVGESITMA